MRLGRIALVAATAAAGLCLGTTGAWAYFSTTGHGTGTAAAGQLSVQVYGSAPGEVGTGLLPGHTGDAVLRLHNPQSIPVTLMSVEAAGDPVADNGCSPTGVSFTNQYQLDVRLAPGATELVPLPGAVAMSADAAATCQGAGFEIPVTVTVRS